MAVVRPMIYVSWELSRVRHRCRDAEAQLHLATPSVGDDIPHRHRDTFSTETRTDVATFLIGSSPSISSHDNNRHVVGRFGVSHKRSERCGDAVSDMACGRAGGGGASEGLGQPLVSEKITGHVGGLDKPIGIE